MRVHHLEASAIDNESDNTTDPHNTRQRPEPTVSGISHLPEILRQLRHTHACTVISDCAFLVHASIPRLPSAPPSPPTTPSLPSRHLDRHLPKSPRPYSCCHTKLASTATGETGSSQHCERALSGDDLGLSSSPQFCRNCATPEAILEGLYVRAVRFPSARRRYEDQEAGYIAA